MSVAHPLTADEASDLWATYRANSEALRDAAAEDRGSLSDNVDAMRLRLDLAGYDVEWSDWCGRLVTDAEGRDMARASNTLGA